jgi:hypothetical protein
MVAGQAMKLRLQENSVRFRVNAGEVESLGAGERLEQRIDLGPGDPAALTYSVAPGGDRMALAFSGGALSLTVPAADIAAWAGSEKQLSIEDIRGALEIVLEKDLERPRRH